MTSHTRRSFLALVCALAAPAVAQTISSPYDLDYTYVDLGSITGVNMCLARKRLSALRRPSVKLPSLRTAR